MDQESEINPEWLTDVETVGLTSGASVPEELVDGVLGYLAEHGFADLDEYTEIEEKLLFALPPELRRDMKAKAAGSQLS